MSVAKRAKSKSKTSLIDNVVDRLEQNKQVRRTLPQGGRLHIDRQLPFLFVYRQPDDHGDRGTSQLVKSEASYLVVKGWDKESARLVRAVVATLSEQFGAFLLVEVWAEPDGGKADDPAEPGVLPTFMVTAPRDAGLNRTVEALSDRLNKIKILKHGVRVQTWRQAKTQPPDLPALLTPADVKRFNCSILGIGVPPVYRAADGLDEFPIIQRKLRRSMGLALRSAAYEFSRAQTTHRPKHYHELGRRATVKAVWEVDRQLAEVSDSFDYLLQLTPVNAGEAFKEFKRSNFERVPAFHYRPQPIDPTLLQRQLYAIPVERMEDPALQRLFREKQEELDLKITMLRDRDTRRFKYESLQLFGDVDQELLGLANDLLEQLSSGREKGGGKKYNAKAFADRAEQEFEFYRQSFPDFTARTRIADDVSGLIVSGGELLINSDLSMAASRVEPLMAHEVGTHLLTYFNGRTQPFHQLFSGLAGYEELQEGLAVFSEYLVDGLTRARMRQLAARVVAAKQMIEGAPFIQTFRLLDRTHDFSQKQAFSITMRVYRGGGLSKDAIYLRGLQRLLKQLQKGLDFDSLFIGKIAAEHIPLMTELQYRKVLQHAAVRPRYLNSDVAQQRLAAAREASFRVIDLVADH